jgi:hypothetical protein
MTDKIFDDAFLSRLALTIRSAEREDIEANDPEPLEPEDYDAIYTAYEENGGDPATARQRIATVREQRDQALSRILQFVSDTYGFGPVEQLDDEKLKGVARDAFEATICWMEDVEMQPGPSRQESPLRVLLRTHYQLHESMLDLHDEILWPIAKRISPID